ncbi:MAG: hypothetical protein M1829_002017 [Trizodia sp. TS-e1964]|nr:MAG: hypothetical protein M1829_002017 [Trizodia sp. TS-e1964]
MRSSPDYGNDASSLPQPRRSSAISPSNETHPTQQPKRLRSRERRPSYTIDGRGQNHHNYPRGRIKSEEREDGRNRRSSYREEERSPRRRNYSQERYRSISKESRRDIRRESRREPRRSRRDYEDHRHREEHGPETLQRSKPARRRSRSESPQRQRHRHSPSPPPNTNSREPRRPSRRSPSPFKRSSKPLPRQNDLRPGPHQGSNRHDKASVETAETAMIPAAEKQQPNFLPSGALAAETNTINGIVLKYNEPPEARKPPAKDDWRLYVFKGADLLETVQLGSRSCWLIGRERAVVDFPIEHPSASKQHAAIQFRHVTKTNEFGDRVGGVRPYLLDLESANGTFVNGEQLPPSRYVEMKDKDVVVFGLSSREYVLMLPPA